MKRFCLILMMFLSVSAGAFRADINRDGRVDFLDLAILAEEWLMSSKCLQFDGSTGYVTVPNNAALNFGTGDFSISCWFKTTAPNGADATLIQKSDGSTFYKLVIRDGTVTFRFKGPLNDTSWVSLGDTFNDGQWHHVAIVYDADDVVKIYTDGENVSGSEATLAGDLDNASDALIGYNESDFFIGSIDDLRIYKGTLLSDDHVSAIYNSGIGTKYTAAAGEGGAASAAWDMDEAGGTTITDEVASLAGTITGTVSFIYGGTPFEPVIEMISRNIETAINAVTTANGFRMTLTAIRPRQLDFSGILLNDKKVFIWRGNHESIGNGASLAAEWLVDYEIGAFIIDSETETDSIEIRLNRAVADIQKKLKEDVTRGGYAIDTLFPSVMKIEDVESTGVLVNIKVHYRTKDTDPYTQI